MRYPSFSGSFYPADPSDLESFIEVALNKPKMDSKSIQNAFAYVAPHASYTYSGYTAGHTYKALSMNKQLDKTDTIIIVGPTHIGYGNPIAVSTDDWQTPLGFARNDLILSRELGRDTPYISIDENPHRNEHSIEVQLPFLQTVFNKKYCFVSMLDQSLDACDILVENIIKATVALDKKVLVVASSDLNHYETSEITKEKDKKILEPLLDLDFNSFQKIIPEIKNSVCGYGPITVAAMFAQKMGAKKGILLDYKNSGDITTEYGSVVGYSSIAFV